MACVFPVLPDTRQKIKKQREHEEKEARVYHLSDTAAAIMHLMHSSGKGKGYDNYEIADALGSTPRQVAPAVNGLVKKGLLVKTEDNKAMLPFE